MEINGKVVIVTGASSGIGAATARQFGREGARVVLTARRVDRLAALAEEIVAMHNGAEPLIVPADLTQLEDIQILIKQTLEKFGCIDILINNAGFGRLDWLENLDPVKDIQTQFEINVLGVIQITRLVLPVMLQQRSGHIINMGSIAGLIATPTYSIYAACKHALHGFSEALRREVQPLGIKVSMIYPGGVQQTEFGARAGIKRKVSTTTPKFMLLTAEEVARCVVQLVRRPRAMWILPWMWWVMIWFNRNLNWLIDYTAIHNFTIPERADEINKI